MTARSPGSGHVRPLTSLRFFAALWVLLHHALPRDDTAGGFRAAIGTTGWLGVSLFFVLSGFLLTVRYAPDGRLRGTQRAFWNERIARLAPTYALALLFALPLFTRDAVAEGMSVERVAAISVSVLTLQQSWRPELACAWNCPAWSLSVETWFYFAFPLSVLVVGGWLVRSRWRGALVLGGAIAASFAIFPPLERIGAGWPLPVYSLSPLARWPEFVAGIGLACLVRTWRPRSRTVGFALFSAGITWLVLAVTARPSIAAATLHLLPVALPGFVLLIAGGWVLRHHSAGPLDAAPAVLLGEASYVLYLFHAPLHAYMLAVVNRVVGRGYDTSWGVFAAYVVLALGLSVLVFERFERPWRHRLRLRLGLGSGGG